MKTVTPDCLLIRGGVSLPPSLALLLPVLMLMSIGQGRLLADRSDNPGPGPGAPADTSSPESGPVGKAPFQTPPTVPAEDLREGVQITELGCMRALLAMDPSSADISKLIAQRLVDADFRVFPAPHEVPAGDLAPKDLHKIGSDRYADLVVHAAVESSLRNRLGMFSVYEAEATLRVYSPMSEEIIATHTARIDGERKANEKEAERSARERAAEAATGEIIAKLLEKAHKVIVLEAEFHGVASREHLMQIIEYASRLDGVYHIRQMIHDKETRRAVIEVIAAPRAENFWRAYLETWPQPDGTVKAQGGYRFQANDRLREKHGAWFQE